MIALSRVLLLLLLGVALAAGCGKPTSGSGNSNTNWLHACTGSEECGVLACLCGRCTRPCSRGLDCTEFGAAAVCAPGSNLQASCEERTVCMRSSDLKDTSPTDGGPRDGASDVASPNVPESGGPDAPTDPEPPTPEAGPDGKPPLPDFEDGSVVAVDSVHGCAAIRHRPGASFETTADVLPPRPPELAGTARNEVAISASGVIVGHRAVDVVRLPGTPAAQSFLAYQPFLWTEEGVRDVVMPDGIYSATSWTPNCDASVLVGGTHGATVAAEAVVVTNRRASRWSESGGAVPLPPADDAQLDETYNASARFVDASGSIILGASFYSPPSGGNLKIATRWVGDGRAIETDFGAGNPENQGVSADGRVLVGSNDDPSVLDDTVDVLVWTQAAPLATIHLDGVAFRATALKADGSAIYGNATGCHTPDWECEPDEVSGVNPFHSFVWTRAEGPQKLPGFRAVVGVSASGAVIAGMAQDRAAAVWDATHGLRRLTDVLATYGVSVPSEWSVLQLTGMSQDARIFTGVVRRSATDAEGELFRASLPADAFR